MIRPLLAAAAFATALVAVPALAQYKDKVPYDTTYDDEIVIVVRYVQRNMTGRSASGAPIEELSTSLVVSAHDLDLRYERDVAELHRRIRATAREACNDLERESRGVMLDSDSECVRDATRDAMAEANAMVYSARG